jgi:hypothetical protein
MGKLNALKKGADIKKIEALIDNSLKTEKVESKRSMRKNTVNSEASVARPPSQAETMKYLQLPSQLAFVARALTQLDGVGTMLGEGYEFIDAVTAKVPELQMGRGAGISYLADQSSRA